MAFFYRGARKAIERYIEGVKKATNPNTKTYYKEDLMLWDFSKPEVVENWDCICDSDIGGHSHTTFELNSKGTCALKTVGQQFNSQAPLLV